MTQKRFVSVWAEDAVRDISPCEAKAVLLTLCRDTEDQHLLCEIATLAEKFNQYKNEEVT